MRISDWSSDVFSSDLINQMGYLPGGVKTAVLLCKEDGFQVKKFELRDALTNEVVLRSGKVENYGEYAAFSRTFRLDFSEFKTPGAFFVTASGVRRSEERRVGKGV